MSTLTIPCVSHEPMTQGLKLNKFTANIADYTILLCQYLGYVRRAFRKPYQRRRRVVVWEILFTSKMITTDSAKELKTRNLILFLDDMENNIYPL